MQVEPPVQGKLKGFRIRGLRAHRADQPVHAGFTGLYPPVFLFSAIYCTIGSVWPVFLLFHFLYGAVAARFTLSVFLVT